jgi:HSP20 family protein
MLTRFDDFDRSFAAMNHLRRRMDRLFEEMDGAGANGGGVERLWSGRFPHIAVQDDGATLTLRADVPGLAEKDVELTVHQDVLTLRGERKEDAPEGRYVHRQERTPVKFSRSFALPCKVDPDQSTASIKNGVLTVTLAKAAEAKPRQIAVKAN